MSQIQQSRAVHPAPSDPFAFERRRHHRQPSDRRLTAIWFEGADALAMIAPVRVLDVSEGGMGLACDKPLEPGQRIALSDGADGPVEPAVVVRCAWADSDYRLGVRYETRAAA